MAVVGVSHLHCLDFNVTSKKRVDKHVIKILGLLPYDELPTFKLNHEARDIFWTKNDIQVDWEELGIFFYSVFGSSIEVRPCISSLVSV